MREGIFGGKRAQGGKRLVAGPYLLYGLITVECDQFCHRIPYVNYQFHGAKVQ